MSLIQDLINQPNITVSITGSQLYEFAEQILAGAKQIYEKKEMPEEYITRKQAAEMLQVTLATLWRWNDIASRRRE